MKLIFVVAVLLLTGCAGASRGLSSFSASNIGADWVVVQYRADGEPMNCWKLKSAAISNEAQSDGIFWKDPKSGHMVHISGWYNRVEVFRNGYAEAGKQIGVDIDHCVSGKYPAQK